MIIPNRKGLVAMFVDNFHLTETSALALLTVLCPHCIECLSAHHSHGFMGCVLDVFR
jgi:hypothetical protein